MDSRIKLLQQQVARLKHENEQLQKENRKRKKALKNFIETSALGREFYNDKREVPVGFMPFRYMGVFNIGICKRGWQVVE